MGIFQISVIPAKAGIQRPPPASHVLFRQTFLDSGFRRNNGVKPSPEGELKRPCTQDEGGSGELPPIRVSPILSILYIHVG